MDFSSKRNALTDLRFDFRLTTRYWYLIWSQSGWNGLRKNMTNADMLAEYVIFFTSLSLGSSPWPWAYQYNMITNIPPNNFSHHSDYQFIHIFQLYTYDLCFWSLQVVWSLTTWRSPSHTHWPATSPRSRHSSFSSSPTFLFHWERSPSSVSTWALIWWAVGTMNPIYYLKPCIISLWYFVSGIKKRLKSCIYK